MIYWAPLLHFYQPPTQLHWVLERVCNESYRPLIQVFREFPTAKVTVNINAVLTELLREHGMDDVIEGLRDLARRGQLEFTGSGKYHPILPLIPPDEMTRQIELNRQTNECEFYDSYHPKGFFSPEMCYSREIVKPVVEAGYQWIILSGVACSVGWPTRVIHRIAHNDKTLWLFFRDDILSNKISFQSVDGRGFLAHLTYFRYKGEDAYVITAMDAETFGHHIKNWEKLFLAEVYGAIAPAVAQRIPGQPLALAEQHGSLLKYYETAVTREVQVVTISQLLDLFPGGSVVEPKASSWSTTGPDLQADNPYPLWKDKNNPIHQLQWQHMNICIEMVKKAMAVADNDTSRYYADISRGLLDRALHSDQFWWASRRPMWDINLINRGLMQQHEALLNAYKAIRTSGLSEEEKTRYYYLEVAARDIRAKIRDQLFRD